MRYVMPVVLEPVIEPPRVKFPDGHLISISTAEAEDKPAE